MDQFEIGEDGSGKPGFLRRIYNIVPKKIRKNVEHGIREYGPDYVKGFLAYNAIYRSIVGGTVYAATDSPLLGFAAAFGIAYGCLPSASIVVPAVIMLDRKIRGPDISEIVEKIADELFKDEGKNLPAASPRIW